MAASENETTRELQFALKSVDELFIAGRLSIKEEVPRHLSLVGPQDGCQRVLEGTRQRKLLVCANSTIGVPRSSKRISNTIMAFSTHSMKSTDFFGEKAYFFVRSARLAKVNTHK